MVTKTLVAQAYRQGKITLKIDPNMESGTVAAIGDDWFYFGGITADEMSPEEYQKNVPEDDIIREIWDVLDEFRTENPDEYVYCESVLLESASHWAEIRCDYLDEETLFWSVDAWKTSDDAESGEVIAQIDDLTGRVIYIEPLARVDRYAQEVIQAKIAQLEYPLLIVKKPSCIDIHIPTKNGTIIAKSDIDDSNKDKIVYLYKEYNDGLAYGEEYTRIFEDKEDAKELLEKRIAEDYYGMTLDELKTSPKFRSAVLDDCYVSITNDGGDTSFFCIEPLAVERKKHELI